MPRKYLAAPYIVGIASLRRASCSFQSKDCYVSNTCTIFYIGKKRTGPLHHARLLATKKRLGSQVHGLRKLLRRITAHPIVLISGCTEAVGSATALHNPSVFLIRSSRPLHLLPFQSSSTSVFPFTSSHTMLIALPIRSLQIQRLDIHTLQHPHINTRHAREEILVLGPRHTRRPARAAEVMAHFLGAEGVGLFHRYPCISTNYASGSPPPPPLFS